jgi:peptidoglycan/xylan/chitin deacetylase (PgdA/CDA1 family)
MKIYTRLILPVLILLPCFIISCKKSNDINQKTIDQTNIHISKWYNGASSAVSFIWDDSNSNHYTTIAPIFNSYGYHTSFAIITSQLDNLVDGYKSVIASGHEICSHSVTHAEADSISPAQMNTELRDSKEAIRKIFGIITTTYIHPYNHTNEIYNKYFNNYYLFSRIYNKNQDSTNFIENILSSTDYRRLVNIYNLGLKTNNWITFAGHGLDDSGWQPIKAGILKQFLSFLKDDTNTWVDTFARIAIYNEVRLKINSVITGKDFIKVDDHAINYARYTPFAITEIPITIEIQSAVDEYNFTGGNIIEQSYTNNTYYISINLHKGNQIHYSLKKNNSLAELNKHDDSPAILL